MTVAPDAARYETIGQAVDALHRSLSDYIEATYHISHPKLIEQRKSLLRQPGAISQVPFLESTPRYQATTRFADIPGIPPSALHLFQSLTAPSRFEQVLVHDPPYDHQAQTVEAVLCQGKSAVVMTGTGSGKTECFLLPMLGKLADLAHRRPDAFAPPSVRAILLYPMNALVNDQLGRLRLLFGDPRVVDWFKAAAGRPARFARYTSRSLYPGLRTSKKDGPRLKPIGDYYVRLLRDSRGEDSVETERQEEAKRLVAELERRGKWPAKPDLAAWYGKEGTRWQNARGEFVRAATLPGDAELLTRHEVQDAPPDVLVTNYSMLEYMLMRPLESGIFDQTRDWLATNPDERFLLVVDEAHLYRGAAGAEVALLIRRLSARLGIRADRLQVICTSASFQDRAKAPEFAAQLAGKDPADVVLVEGKLHTSEATGTGGANDVDALQGVDLRRFYENTAEAARLKAIRPFLDFRGVAPVGPLHTTLLAALEKYPPLGTLIDETMRRAVRVDQLGTILFPRVDPERAARAVTALIALACVARPAPDQPGLLPSRVHAFFRGLPGLWACLDPDCPGAAKQPNNAEPGPVGRLYDQPRSVCDSCDGRVLELYTCRNCGAAYGRAFTDDLENPTFLWAEPGLEFEAADGRSAAALQPLDLLLEAPDQNAAVEPKEYDLATGRLNPPGRPDRARRVFLRKDRTGKPVAIDNDDSDGGSAHSRRDKAPGEFRPCGVCGQTAAYGRTSVQDHLTKGDQPFQAVVARQLQVQPPSGPAATAFAPLRGRKVLVFSDSRQTAARLAPNLQMYANRDVLRPLLARGYDLLAELGARDLVLDDAVFALLAAATDFDVRIRPQLRPNESFSFAEGVRDRIRDRALLSPYELERLRRTVLSAQHPSNLLADLYETFTSPYYGLEALGLASIVEADEHQPAISALPPIKGIAETPEQKRALARAWIRAWRRQGFWLSGMTADWWNAKVRGHKSGKFQALDKLLRLPAQRNSFTRDWLPKLRLLFCESIGGMWRLRGTSLGLQIDGKWAYCDVCRDTVRPFPGRPDLCVNCGRERAREIDPDTDRVFSARKGYYRVSSVDARRKPPVPPLALVAAEHTAQLNDAQDTEIFSKAEEHELLFQDVAIPDAENRPRTAIDVLSCTTTMEVGIDIGALSGVALRTMPPARANYQQRAGRAGRRGNALATVVAFGSADSHDEHYFSHPEEMIAGQVVDPTLTLNNAQLVRRHVTAYLLQRYLGDTLRGHVPSDAENRLFAVLGSVPEFLNPASPLNRQEFGDWLRAKETALRSDINAWLPVQLSAADRASLLDDLAASTLKVIDEALAESTDDSAPPKAPAAEADDTDTAADELAPEAGIEPPRRRNADQPDFLLDRLLERGVLPRYAFPTDVATFHVFDKDKFQPYRPVFKYTPSQSLRIALSSYAPSMQVWIDGLQYTSGAIYSPGKNERPDAWKRRLLYQECQVCDYARTKPQGEVKLGTHEDCPGCLGVSTLSGAQNWLRPPGFAHPVNIDPQSSSDDQPDRSYASRAKLSAPAPADDEAGWLHPCDLIAVYPDRKELIVTNRGPRDEGYRYCTSCGRIAPYSEQGNSKDTVKLDGPHSTPYPALRNGTCAGYTTTLVLGSSFRTDLAIVRLTVDPPVLLKPGMPSTRAALRTVGEAIAAAACELLELEPQELEAEFRPALTERGPDGYQAEIYLYDTLPGGAGFSHQAADLGRKLLEKALERLQSCSADCDASCYRCLRSYKNKLQHPELDRHVGAALLEYLLGGAEPTLSPRRIERSTDLLFADLKRQDLDGVGLERDVDVKIEDVGTIRAPILVTARGRQTIVALSNPLAPGRLLQTGLQEIADLSGTIAVRPVDELHVRHALPDATSTLIHDLSLG